MPILLTGGTSGASVTNQRCVQEEQAAAGVQRHFWWRLPLPEGQQHTAFVSPIFDAIWVAEKPKHIFNGGTSDLDSARYNYNFAIHGAHCWMLQRHV